MAEIWHVTDSNGQPFALKRMHQKLKHSWIAKRRFRKGCEVLAQVHENEFVIEYLEHGKIEGLPYMLMEYVESSNLKEVFTRGDDVLDEYAGNILIDMAIALDHVHSCGFMHLDIKPENVLITRNGNVRLVDFDLALPKPKKPKKLGKCPGTPAYMAPEQLMKKPVDARADLWAFGVTAYELLTHKKPFPGDNPKEVLRYQLDRDDYFVMPRDHNEGLTEGLEAIILKCLQHDPNDRYPYASVLVRDLEQELYV